MVNTRIIQSTAFESPSLLRNPVVSHIHADDMSDDLDSSSHDVAPSNAELENALRQAVRQIYKAGNLEELTVKRVRKAAEGILELKEGFFKAHGNWNKKSKDVIQSEVVGIPLAVSVTSSTHNHFRTINQTNLHTRKLLNIRTLQTPYSRNNK